MIRMIRMKTRIDIYTKYTNYKIIINHNIDKTLIYFRSHYDLENLSFFPRSLPMIYVQIIQYKIQNFIMIVFQFQMRIKIILSPHVRNIWNKLPLFFS